MVTVAQPFEVKLVQDPPSGEPEPPDWAGAITQLRTVAQWVIGGVVATAAGVFAGGSLSNIGAMNFAADSDRLWLAIYGVGAGFLAIAAIMFFGISVLAPHGHNLSELAEARWPSVNKRARKLLFKLHQIESHHDSLKSWIEEGSGTTEKAWIRLLYPVAPFCAVRARFDRLILCMVVCVPIAIFGFGLFAWAANPPDKPAAPKPGIELKITY